MSNYQETSSLLNWSDYHDPNPLSDTSEKPVENKQVATLEDNSNLEDEEGGGESGSSTPHHSGATGLEQLEMGASRIQVDDKKLLIAALILIN